MNQLKLLTAILYCSATAMYGPLGYPVGPAHGSEQLYGGQTYERVAMKTETLLSLAANIQIQALTLKIKDPGSLVIHAAEVAGHAARAMTFTDQAMKISFRPEQYDSPQIRAEACDRLPISGGDNPFEKLAIYMGQVEYGVRNKTGNVSVIRGQMQDFINGHPEPTKSQLYAFAGQEYAVRKYTYLS